MGKMKPKAKEQTSLIVRILKGICYWVSILGALGILGVVLAAYVQEPLVIQGVMHDDFSGENISFWKRTIQDNITIQNQGIYPIVSDLGEEAIESEVHSIIDIVVRDENKNIVFHETRNFKDIIQPTKPGTVSFEFILPDNIKGGVLSIQLLCSTTFGIRRCHSQIEKIEHKFEIRDTSSWEIVGIDVTREGVDELKFFREDLLFNLGIIDTTTIYKTIPAGIEFPAFHRDSRESWGGIILLYNRAQGHEELSDTTQKMKTMLEKRYNLPVILKEYNGEKYEYYTRRFDECRPEGGKNICVTHTMNFLDLHSGEKGSENLFSKSRFFSDNPKLDFMFLLPYSN